jgi:hypothetical protein
LVKSPATGELVAAEPGLRRGPVLAAAMMAIVLTATEGSIVATAAVGLVLGCALPAALSPTRPLADQTAGAERNR